MINPFKYGKIVSGDDFADREKETKQLVNDIESGQNILLYSPRRYGKSSLILRVLEKIKQDGMLTSYVDLYGCLTISDFVEKLIKETVVPSQGTFKKISAFFKENLSGIEPEIVLKSDGSASVRFKKELESKGTEVVLSKVLDAPQILAENKKKRVVVAFDEFQEISHMDGTNIEKMMRSCFQRHKDVTYLFAGSKRHIIEEIFGKEKRPFYRFAKSFPITKISPAEFEEFILGKFKETKVAISHNVVDIVLRFTDGHPYLTQQLCHELWNISCEKREATEGDISKALDTILQQHGDYYSGTWDALAASQKKLMNAIAQELRVQNVYAKSFVSKYGLVSPSHVKKALASLEREALIERDTGYYIEDVFLREWIRHNFSSSATSGLTYQS